MASSRSVAWRQMIETARKASAKCQNSASQTMFLNEEEPQLESTPLLSEFYSRFPFVLGLLNVFSQKDLAQNPSRRYLWTGNHFVPTYFAYFIGKACNSEESRLMSLANTFQYFYLSQEFHKTVSIPTKGDHKYNNVSTLVGDLFITEACRAVAKVKNNEIAELAFETLAELCIQNFPSDDNQPKASSEGTSFYASVSQSIALLNSQNSEEESEECLEIFNANPNTSFKVPVQDEDFRKPLEDLVKYISLR